MSDWFIKLFIYIGCNLVIGYMWRISIFSESFPDLLFYVIVALVGMKLCKIWDNRNKK